MLHAGYEHPLYSFELILSVTALDEEAARYAIAVPQGYLVVRDSLRRRGARIDCEVLFDAVLRAAALHQRFEPYLTPFGLSGAWREHLFYWNEEMHRLNRQRVRLINQHEVQADQRRGLADARDLWRRLVLTTRLAGLGDTILSGRPPQNGLVLGERLQQVAGEVARPDRAALLARFGFGPAEQELLLRTLAALPAERQREYEHRQALRRLTDVLAVIRGALIGELGRLAEVAKGGLPPAMHRLLQMNRLLPPARRRSGTGGDDPSGPVTP